MSASGQERQRTNDKQRIDKVCDQFMILISENKVHDALQLLKENTVMSFADIDSLEVTINNQMTATILPIYGNVISHDFISERKVKDHLAKRLYILKFEKYLLKFSFTLYNNSKTWVITNFNYNDDMLELFY